MKKFINVLLVLLILMPVGMYVFLVGCGSDKTVEVQKTILPAIKKVTLTDPYTKQESADVESGMYLIGKYTTDQEIFENVNVDTSKISDSSIPLVLYLVSADTNVENTDSNTYQLGGDFYNYAGGQLEVIIPENVPSGTYRILSIVDPDNQYNIINNEFGKSSYITDTIVVTDSQSSIVEITSFNVTEKTALYSDSDSLMYDTQTFVEVQYDSTAHPDSPSLWDTTLVNVQKIIQRPGHIKVNFDLTLRGEVAMAPDTTYVGFYLELWQEEKADSNWQYLNQTMGLYSNDTMVAKVNQWAQSVEDTTATLVTADNLWTYLKVLKSGDTEQVDQMNWEFPVSFANDTRAHQTYSYSLNLWMPDTTAQLVSYINNLSKKSVWRIVMYVRNESVAATKLTNLAAREKFYAEDYVRVLKIDPLDLFPDGSRAPMYANEQKMNHIRPGIERKDYTSKGGGWGAYLALYQENYGSSRGYITEIQKNALKIWAFGQEIPIIDVTNQYLGNALNIKKSYRRFYIKVWYWTIYSTYDELGNNSELGLKIDPLIEWEKDLTNDKFVKDFMVGPVPLTAKATIDLKIGMGVFKGLVSLHSGARFNYGGLQLIGGYALNGGSLDVYGAKKEYVGIVGKLIPYAELSTTISCGIGSSKVASAGVFGSLTLVKISFPIILGTYGQALASNGSACDYNSGIPVNASKMKAGCFIEVRDIISTLDGKIGLYAELNIKVPKICWWGKKVWKVTIHLPYPCGWQTVGSLRYELPIVSWNGLSWNQRIYRHTFGNAVASLN